MGKHRGKRKVRRQSAGTVVSNRGYRSHCQSWARMDNIFRFKLFHKVGSRAEEVQPVSPVYFEQSTKSLRFLISFTFCIQRQIVRGESVFQKKGRQLLTAIRHFQRTDQSNLLAGMWERCKRK